MLSHPTLSYKRDCLALVPVRHTADLGPSHITGPQGHIAQPQGIPPDWLGKS